MPVRYFTWRDLALHVEPDLDVAEGEGPDLPDLLVGGEAGARVDEDGHRVEENSAALPLRRHVRGGEQVVAVDVAQRDELLAPDD